MKKKPPKKTKKTCTKCNATKPIKAFRADSRKRDGHTATCKACRNASYSDHERAVKLERTHKLRSMRAGVMSLMLAEDFAIILNTPNCSYCACNLTPKTVHVDHVLPISGGFENAPGNCVASCRSCNSSKHNRNIYEFLVVSDNGKYGEERFDAFCKQFATLNGAPESWQHIRQAFINDYALHGRDAKRTEVQS